MTKTNVQPTPSNSQHHDTPNNKTHIIKFRVTAEEKASLELTCKLLNLSLSTFIRRAIHNVKIEKTVIVAGGGKETLTAVSTLLAQCSKVGSNLNQLARHFNSGGADTEQIRAKLLDELADLTAFRLNAEKVLGELYGNAHVDGHNRYAILQKHPEIYFSTMPLPFESREEVLAWICKNQLGRRNLTPEQKKFLMGKQYSSEKRTEAFRGNQHTAKKSGSVQSEHNQKPMKTCERIAQENHSSASSVRRAEYYAHGVDVADELSPGFRDRFFREELHIPDYLLENLGKAKPEEQAEIFEEIKNYVPKPKKVKLNKVTVKQAEKAASNTIDENYDVPQKFLDLYYRLHNAESLMRKSWEVTFDLNPKLLTHPEQVKVLRFALKPHLEFLKTLDEVLAESSSESSKTA